MEGETILTLACQLQDTWYIIMNTIHPTAQRTSTDDGRDAIPSIDLDRDFAGDHGSMDSAAPLPPGSAGETLMLLSKIIAGLAPSLFIKGAVEPVFNTSVPEGGNAGQMQGNIMS